MYEPKVAIIIPTIHRDDLLMKVINSIINVWHDDWKVFILDQNKEEDYTEEKRIFYETACSQFHSDDEQRVHIEKVPYDSGISYCRNKGVDLADDYDIPYCIIGADSIEFTDSIKELSRITDGFPLLNTIDVHLIGFDLANRNIGWEADLDLTEDGFVLDFIEKPKTDKRQTLFCDIVRNFFIATTITLRMVKWDNELKMAEHEDFFWRYKEYGFGVMWCNFIRGEYIGEKDGEYAKLRQKNFKECKSKLLKKYNIKKWVSYKNLDRAKE
jgi:glycosyltransferase involved in cell wall biosynthesis